VEAEKTPEVLARVVLLFHRCTVDIVSFGMVPVRNLRRVRITISVEVNASQAARMKANLHKVVSVLTVRTAKSR